MGCVVDDILDASSSSSSSSDDEGDSSSSDRGGGGRGGAAGGQAGRAPPRRGSMPGWIGRLEERERAVRLPASSAAGLAASPAEPAAASAAAAALAGLQLAAGGEVELRCRELGSWGRLCRAQVSLSATPTEGAAGAARAGAATAGGWQQAVGETLLSALSHAGLSPADIASLKIYCAGEGMLIAAQALRGALQQPLEGSQAAVVPAVAVGTDAQLGAALLVELLAVRRQAQ